MSHRQTTDESRWVQVESILDRILEYEGDRTRDELLLELCGEDQGLRNEVESLLESADQDGDLLDQPLAEATPDLVATLEDEMREAAGGDRAGRTIDRYRLIKVLGRGGMGVVYLAERADQQFDKRVAIKLMPRGLETGEGERRFLIERQILARLEHPGIARLLDGGVNDEGYPYLVMEYVEGFSIDRYCGDQDLSVRQRLELMIEVCDAVQYAHQNLVVHRDLKPNNILVTAEGQVKLLDFGVGKILEQTDSDLSTVFHPMTPDYASPEQIANQPVSTASDVYSLGILIYKLLTGTHPYRLGGLSPTQAQAVVSQGELRAPSSAIDEDCDQAESDAPRIGRARLRRRLEGDLDNIVLKALRREPERRYLLVADLAADLQRHLSGLPVRARPITKRYRIGKFIGRHRLGVGVASAVTLLVCAALAGIVWQGRVAARERDRARVEARRAEQVAGILGGLFEAANPQSAAAGQLSARELLDQGGTKIRHELDAEPQIRGPLLEVMSNAYTALGDFDRAEELAQTGVDDLRGLSEVPSTALAKALTALGRARLEKGEYEAATPPLNEALEILERKTQLDSREAAMAHRYLGLAEERSISSDMGAAHHRIAIKIWSQLGLDAELAKETHYLAGSLDAVGRTEEGLQLKQQALKGLTASYGQEHPFVASVRNDIAYSLHRAGNTEAAEPLYRQAIAINERILGPDHIEVAESLTNLGRLLMDQRRFQEAEPVVKRAVEIMQTSVDENQFERIGGEVNLASLYVELGRLDEAIPIYRSALARFDRLMGPDDIPTVRVASLLARALHRQGQLSESEDLYRHAVRQQRISSPPKFLGESLIGLGAVLCDLKDYETALPLLEEGLAIYQQALPEGDWRIGQSRIELAGALIDPDRPDEADNQLEAGLTLLADAGVKDAWIEARAKRFGQQLKDRPTSR